MSDGGAIRKSFPSLEMAARNTMRTVTSDLISAYKEEELYDTLRKSDDCIKGMMADLYDQRIKVENLETTLLISGVTEIQDRVESTYHRVNVLESRIKALEEMIASPADCSYTVTKGVGVDAAACSLATRHGVSLVVGSKGSGKTTLIESTMLEALKRDSPDGALDVLYVSPRKIPHVRDGIPGVQVMRTDEGTSLADLAAHKRLADEQWATIVIDDADSADFLDSSRGAFDLRITIGLFQRLRVPVVLALQRLPISFDSADSFGKTGARCVVTLCPTTLGTASVWAASEEGISTG